MVSCSPRACGRGALSTSMAPDPLQLARVVSKGVEVRQLVRRRTLRVLLLGLQGEGVELRGNGLNRAGKVLNLLLHAVGVVVHLVRDPFWPLNGPHQVTGSQLFVDGVEQVICPLLREVARQLVCVVVFLDPVIRLTTQHVFGTKHTASNISEIDGPVFLEDLHRLGAENREGGQHRVLSAVVVLVSHAALPEHPGVARRSNEGERMRKLCTRRERIALEPNGYGGC